MQRSILYLPSLGFELILEKYWNQVIALLFPISERILSSERYLNGLFASFIVLFLLGVVGCGRAVGGDNEDTRSFPG
jgi:hypothetical protein